MNISEEVVINLTQAVISMVKMITMSQLQTITANVAQTESVEVPLAAMVVDIHTLLHLINNNTWEPVEVETEAESTPRLMKSTALSSISTMDNIRILCKNNNRDIAMKNIEEATQVIVGSNNTMVKMSTLKSMNNSIKSRINIIIRSSHRTGSKK